MKKTYTIGQKTYSEDEFSRITFTKELLDKLREVQDRLYNELGIDLDTDNDFLFDFVWNDIEDNVKVNTESE